MTKLRADRDHVINDLCDFLSGVFSDLYASDVGIFDLWMSSERGKSFHKLAKVSILTSPKDSWKYGIDHLILTTFNSIFMAFKKCVGGHFGNCFETCY